MLHNPFQELTDKLSLIFERLDKIEQSLPPRSQAAPNVTGEDQLLTTSEAALLLGLSVQTIYGKIHRGEIPFHKPPGSKRVYFKSKELMEYVSSGKDCNPSDNRRLISITGQKSKTGTF